MMARLEELKTCNDLIEKHGQALQRSVSDVEGATNELNQSLLDSTLFPKLKVCDKSLFYTV